MNWIIGNCGTGALKWFVLDDKERWRTLQTKDGRLRRFASHLSAQRAADIANKETKQ